MPLPFPSRRSFWIFIRWTGLLASAALACGTRPTQPPQQVESSPRPPEPGVQLLRPARDMRVEWEAGPGTAWSKLDDAVQQPTTSFAPLDDLWAGQPGRVLEVGFEQPRLDGNDPWRGTAWFDAETGDDTQLRVEVVWYGQVRASLTLPPGSGQRWRSVDFTVGTQAEVDDLRLRFTSEAGSRAGVHAAYLALRRPLPSPITLRPDGDVRVDWRGAVGGAWRKLAQNSDPVFGVVATGDSVWPAKPGQVLEVTLSNPTLSEGAAAPATAWFDAETGPDTQLSVDVLGKGGELRASLAVPPGSARAWRSLPFQVHGQADGEELRLRFIAEGGASTQLRAAYVEVRPPPWQVTVVGSSAKVRPQDIADGPPSASLVAARNEFESFQVVVRAGDQPLRNLNVALDGALIGPLGASIPADQVTVYRAEYYNVVTPSDLEGAPGRWPDPLIPAVDRIFGEPRTAFPVDVPAGENRVAWFDVLVPPGAPAGLYVGTATVTADGRLARVPIQLEVLDFELPSTTTLKSAFGLGTGSECAALGFTTCKDPETRAYAKELFVRTALDNRISIAYAHATPLRIGSDTGVAQFRAHTLPFLLGTAPTRLAGARLTTYQVNRVKDFDIAAWRTEMLLQGVADRAFIYGCDEPEFFPVYRDPPGNWKLCLDQLAVLRAQWPEAPELITTHIQSATANGGLGQFDIMVLNLELLDGPENTMFYPGDQRPLYDAFLADPSRPKQLWLYTACGSHGCTINDSPYTNGWGGYDIDAPASETRAIAWLAYRYGASGTLYYDMGTLLPQAWESLYRFSGNGEGTLFYPGTPEKIGGTHPVPIESIRIKQVREGYEDYEYLKFLTDRGLGAEAQQVARQLFPAPYATARSDAEVQEAHRALAALVRSAVAAGGP